MLDDKLVGKQEDTFLLDILMMGVRFTVDAKAGALKARVTDDKLIVFGVAPPSLYIVG